MAKTTKPGGRRPRRKERKNVTYGVAHIKSSFNNTIVSIIRPGGQRHRLGVGGQRRFQGLAQVDPLRRSDGRGAVRPPSHGARRARVDVLVRGPGSGRETAIRSLSSAGIEVTGIKDVTPIPHNGCRPKKRRRV